ncbi:MAG: hypothetical protein AABY75_00785, partial [Bacteroidota bacterium]
MQSYPVRWRDLVICMAAAIAVSSGTLYHGFVNWDDTFLVLTNESVLSPTLASLGHWFTTFDVNPYHPLVHASFALNVLLGGTDPIGFHATNILLHALVTGLVYVFVRHWIADSAAAVVGTLFFALHPLRMESVAWVSGRKDLLCALFLLLAFLAYLQFRVSGSRKAYVVALVLAIAASLSNAIASPFVVVLAAYDRLVLKASSRRTAIAAIPFLLVGIATAAVAGLGQYHNGRSPLDPEWSL